MMDERMDAFDDLFDLLDKERDALLAGNLETVARLFDQKSRLVEEVNWLHDRPDSLVSSMHEKLMRNQGLLDAAAEGIRSVSRRLTAIRRVRHCLETYDAHGRRSTVDIKKTKTLEKRA